MDIRVIVSYKHLPQKSGLRNVIWYTRIYTHTHKIDTE